MEGEIKKQREPEEAMRHELLQGTHSDGTEQPQRNENYRASPGKDTIQRCGSEGEGKRKKTGDTSRSGGKNTIAPKGNDINWINGNVEHAPRTRREKGGKVREENRLREIRKRRARPSS